MRVLITAASGALGMHLIAHLRGKGIAVAAAARGAIRGLPEGTDQFAVGPIDGGTDWRAALAGVTHIVHAAAQTQLGEGEDDRAFDAVNRDGTRNLAEQAAAAGVRRFVQISSAAVNGRISGREPIRVDAAPAPANAYARSKLAGEAALWEVAKATGLEVAVIRPPRIIWPELSGNLKLFEKLIARGAPLPFGRVAGNGRDNVSPENLVQLIALCLTHPAASGRIFFATDDDPLSTRELTVRIAARTGTRPRLLPVPNAVLRAIVGLMPARLLGRLNRQEMIAELLGDFLLDAGPAKSLGWVPQPNAALPRPRRD